MAKKRTKTTYPAPTRTTVDVSKLDTRTVFERIGVTIDDDKRTLFAHTTTATRGRFDERTQK